MAKQNRKTKVQTSGSNAGNSIISASTANKAGEPESNRPFYLLIFLFTCLLYSNTLWNKYAVDDTVVITDNKFTKQGAAGISDLFTHDMFEGAYGERGAHMIGGGRYRPLSLASFALEYEVMRRLRHDSRVEVNDKNVIMGIDDPYLNPALSHAVNILLFALLCITIFYFLQQIISERYSLNEANGFFSKLLSLPFMITMLYAAHPVHTEAVANIKGRDEILCMLFSMLSLVAAIKYVKTEKLTHLLWGMLVFMLALVSKENAVTFMAIIPLTYFFFTKAESKNYGFIIGAYLIPLALFLLLRSKMTQTGLSQPANEILNNPFLLATASQRFATTVYTFLCYYKLLVFPNPLTDDYYYNQIPYVDLGNVFFILSLLLTAALLIYALVNFKKKTIPAYAILFYFITFSLVSNLFFTVGVLMSERLVFMCSLGFCILIAFLLIRYIKNKITLTVILSFILLLYITKTIARNFDWKDSLTLFARDVQWSPNSARLRTVLGNELTLQADKQTDTLIKNRMLDSAIVHLNESLRIYRTNAKAWLLLGNAIYKRSGKPEEAIPYYEKAGALYPEGNYDVWFNLGVAFNQEGKPAQAKENLLKAFYAKPSQQVECRVLLADVYAKLNQPDSAKYWLNRITEFRPLQASDYYSLGSTFGKMVGNMPAAIGYLEKAVQMDPKVELYYEDLGVAYALVGDYKKSIETNLKLIEVNPKYAIAYKNLSILYENAGNKELAGEYHRKYLQLLRISSTQ